ncbi:environmental stress-induced protein Ves [Kitasatospora sp. MAP12-15]|uniref:HutD/Ves family protein n=1 Tax=unclassified Kitasatospora TaxID=2633591 RepID=UPI002474774A|nr:HutD family protein [Kitasatospora sp. MAP12-44]MDH6109091.1 environmental stress-induced protein Ves [Kitasatospora sp. MAP12-44]
MTLHQLPAADRSTTPWRNGGGLTREVAAAPDGSWRVSLAEVAADGPFSTFPGLDRVLTVVEGAGLELTVGDRPPAPVPPLHPFPFPGELPTTGRLIDGPVTALNVMAAHGLPVTVELSGAGAVLVSPAPGAVALVVALAGHDAVQLTHPDTAQVRHAVVLTVGPPPLD